MKYQIFHWHYYLTLKNLKKTSLNISSFFISIDITFLKIILLYDPIQINFFFCWLLQVWYIYFFLYVRPKYFFNRDFWLNLISIYTFCSTNLWSSARFNVLNCKSHSFLQTNYTQVFPIFILNCKNEKSLWRLCNSSEYSTSVSSKYLTSLFLL